MRQPAAQSNSVNYVSNNFPVVAPVGGWNTISSIANMPETDAYFMDNFWPTPTQVEVRKGFLNFAEIPDDDPDVQVHDIRALLSYIPAGSDPQLFACDQTGIWDVTAGGEIGSEETASTSGYWGSLNVTTTGGNFLWCWNGVDKLKIYNGAAWGDIDGVSTPAITGVDTTDIVNACLYKSRIFFAIKNSLKFGYLAVDSIAGAAGIFPLGALFRRGGFLVSVDTWSLDAGNGIDDYIIFWTSEGEIAVYNGINPADADLWSLVGVYTVGAPLSYKSTIKVGGELLLLTKQGVYPISKALRDSSLDKSAAASYKIQQAFDFYIKNGVDLFGWQIIFHPETTMLLVNVPFKRNDEMNYLYSYQFVMNTTNNSWARFTNMASECWGIHQDKIFFARHNKVFQAITGNKDHLAPVIAKVKQAFNTLRSKSYNKHVKMVKPIIQTNGSIGLSLGLDVDFTTDTDLQIQQSFSKAISLWDVAVYDVDVWTGSLIEAEWTTVANSPGMWFSLNLRIESGNSDIAWIATQYMVEKCGYI